MVVDTMVKSMDTDKKMEEWGAGWMNGGGITPCLFYWKAKVCDKAMVVMIMFRRVKTNY